MLELAKIVFALRNIQDVFIMMEGLHLKMIAEPNDVSDIIGPFTIPSILNRHAPPPDTTSRSRQG
jgi:hypothetical protein